jgi:hypothetical protein
MKGAKNMNRVVLTYLILALGSLPVFAAESNSSGSEAAGQKTWLKDQLTADMHAAGKYHNKDYSNVTTWVDQASEEEVELLVVYYKLSRQIAMGNPPTSARNEFGTIDKRLSKMEKEVVSLRNLIYATRRIHKSTPSTDQDRAGSGSYQAPGYNHVPAQVGGNLVQSANVNPPSGRSAGGMAVAPPQYFGNRALGPARRTFTPAPRSYPSRPGMAVLPPGGRGNTLPNYPSIRPQVVVPAPQPAPVDPRISGTAPETSGGSSPGYSPGQGDGE